MAQQNRTVLKGYFNLGDIPTEANFADLIDSFFNFQTDGPAPTGPQGPAGTDGTDGTDGANGADGAAGTNVTITVAADLAAFNAATPGATELVVLNA